MYCGENATTWDHLHPLVVDGMPSGIVPSQVDMLPCCSKCNSSKGKRTWQVFMNKMAQKCTTPAERLAHDKRAWFIHEYDVWRLTHENRWDVQANADTVRELVDLVNDCHSFMQQVVNNATIKMHGEHACTFPSKEPVMDWSSITAQLKHQ